jgi:anti-anti-sigma factor
MSNGLRVLRQDLEDGVVYLRPAGAVDVSDVDSLEQAQRAALTVARRVIVDLEKVTFLDSTGVAVLIAGYRTARSRSKDYRVINPRGVVRRVLDLTGVLTTLAPAG